MSFLCHRRVGDGSIQRQVDGVIFQNNDVIGKRRFQTLIQVRGIFGEGLCALLCCYMLANILRLCEEKAEGIESEDAEEGIDKAEDGSTLEDARLSE